MGKKKSTTSSSKRKFVYRSFRDRVESIKIDPIRDLSRKPYEKTDTSFFIATLSHCTEINLSENFQNFNDEIVPISRSLPQIIFHQKAIFDLLEKYILLNDPLSLQPLLDLLSQFCHDLGPDFMPFYTRALDDIMKIALKQKDPNSLEYIFNALAYIFKYLSRVLSKDLIPTFKQLRPLLVLEHSSYVTKFASQALSFLVRKCHSESLKDFVTYTFSLVDGKSSYHNALAIMYSESLMSASGALFSRTKIIIEQVTLSAVGTPYGESILSDIIMTVSRYASSEGTSPLYDGIFAAIKKLVENAHDNTTLASITQVLNTLSFAESGYKVPSWGNMVTLFELICNKAKDVGDDDSNAFGNSLSLWVSTMIRNMDVPTLKKSYDTIFRGVMSANNGDSFLSFLDLATDITRERTMMYAPAFFSKFVYSHWENYYQQVALFLARMDTKSLIGDGLIKFVLPPKFQQFILKHIKEIVDAKSISDSDLQDLLWKVMILEYSSARVDVDLLFTLSKLIHAKGSTTYSSDLIGHLIGILINGVFTDDQLHQNFQTLTDHLSSDCHSIVFLSRISKLLSKITDGSYPITVSAIKNNRSRLVGPLIGGLKTSSHEIRDQSLACLISIFSTDKNGCPSSISSCRIIEDIPLDIKSSRDIQMRFRNLARDLVSDKSSEIVNQIVAYFAIGQLTVKFAPSWEGVFQFIGPVLDKLSSHLWTSIGPVLAMNYNEIVPIPYIENMDEDMVDELSLEKWYPQTTRLLSSISHADQTLSNYSSVHTSLLKYVESKAADIQPIIFNRLQAIKILNRFPSLAEDHFSEILPYFEAMESEYKQFTGEKDILLSSWTKHDRNELIEMLCGFKKLERVEGLGVITKLMLHLLMSRDDKDQQLALKCLLNMHDQTYDKYKDDLGAMLSDTLFRDEIVRFLQGENRTLSSQDTGKMMPLILRILYGRALTSGTSGTSRGRKIAAFNVVNTLEPKFIEEFLSYSFSKIPYARLETDDLEKDITENLLRNINGFLHTALIIVDALRHRNSDCFAVIVRPIIYSLCVSEFAVRREQNSGAPMDKIAHNNRKLGFKLLYNITDYMGDEFDWHPYGEIIYQRLIKPRLPRFAEENLDGASSLLLLMSKLWLMKNLRFFYYYDDYLPARQMLRILGNTNAKDRSLMAVLEFVDGLLSDKSQDDDFLNLLSVAINACLNTLVDIFSGHHNRDVNRLSVKILLGFVEDKYLADNESRKRLIPSLISALQKNSHVAIDLKKDTSRLLALTLKDYTCTFEEIIPIYDAVSALCGEEIDKQMRMTISEIFLTFASKFDEFNRIGELMVDLNSYSKRRVLEPDYDRRLDAFKKINDDLYLQLSAKEWLPIIYTSLHLIMDEEDLAMRSSAAYTLMRFVDGFSSKETPDDASAYLEIMNDAIVPQIRLGMRKNEEKVRHEYIKVIDHIVRYAKYFDDFDDMKVLLYDGDIESDFFENIIHLQVTRRQKAVRDLPKICDQLSSQSVAHYILPMIEHYAFWTEERFRNLSNETINTVQTVSTRLTWHQFRAIFFRYLSMMKGAIIREEQEKLRDTILLIVSYSRGLNSWATSKTDRPHDYPKIEFMNKFVVEDLLPQLKKCLNERDEATVIHRVPLTEAMVLFIMCCSQDRIDAELPGILTNICQILRARSEELRDAIRKHLSRIALFLGPPYLKFIFQELKGALTRGPQIHILSFTIHYLLVVMSDVLKHGDLDESADLIVESIMNDVFGEAAEEKEAKGYSNRTKEMRHNKSYDTAELLASSISLKHFAHLMTPISYLLQEKLSFKAKNKLDQLLQRFATGLVSNEEADGKDILVLCYQIYTEAVNFVENSKRKDSKKVDEKVDQFMVHLDAKPLRTKMEYSVYIHTMQKFSFELLRAAIIRHSQLLNSDYLSQFIPILVTSLESEDEGVIISALKVLTVAVRLDFPDEINAQFVMATECVLKIMRDTPSTNNEIAQNCLKFLSSDIRCKDEIELKPIAIAYILKRILPDLDEPLREGVAFGFIRSIMSKHMLLPEIYDIMDTISKIMVTSTSKEIRQASRTVFYTFIMEYDQSRGRLEKEFKLLIDNLNYPAESGRKSVMELISLIIAKCDKPLLDKLNASLFLALARDSVTDNSPSCREISCTILSSMFSRMDKLQCNMSFIEERTTTWMKETKNDFLCRCGFNIYKAYISALGVGRNKEMDSAGSSLIDEVLKFAKKDTSEQKSTLKFEVDWQTMYLALSTFEVMVDASPEKSFGTGKATTWDCILESLLYPHTWVRQISSRLIGKLLAAKPGSVKFPVSDSYMQTIAYRSFRVLGAPGVSEELAGYAAKNLAVVSQYWNSRNSAFIEFESAVDVDDGKERPKFASALDWAVNRCGSILRNESRPGNEMVVTKKAMIQYCRYLTSILDSEVLSKLLNDHIFIPLINISEEDPVEGDEGDQSVPSLATQCLEEIKAKIGVTNYTTFYTDAHKKILARRAERKTKRAQLGFTNPQAAARRKFRKHMNIRRKRHNNKDENGFYKPKRRRRN